MELEGRIIMILPLSSGVSKNGNEWRKQEYILETNHSQYPKKVCFNLWGEKIDQFALTEGDNVKVSIDLESREFNGRWYTDVRAWNIEKVGAEVSMDPMAAAMGAPVDFSARPVADNMTSMGSFATPSQEGDDLPF